MNLQYLAKRKTKIPLHLYSVIMFVSHGILGERPYNCSLCFKSFGRRSALRIHIISVHTSIKSYLCTGKLYCP